MYDEDEFLARAGRDERLGAAALAAGDSSVLRAAGAALLLAAAGALGGLIVSVGLSSPSSARRRVVARMLAAHGSPSFSEGRARVWQAPASAEEPRNPGARERSAAPTRVVRRSRRASARTGAIVRPAVVSLPHAAAAAQLPPAPVAVPTPATSEPSATVSVRARQGGQTEFGFER